MARRIPSTTDPVRQLIDEHEIFMEALDELSMVVEAIPDGASRISEDGWLAIEVAWQAIDDHLNVHFVKEEEVFFPQIEHLFQGARVKFQFLHVDHDDLRSSFEKFTHYIQNYRAGTGQREALDGVKRVTKEMVRSFYYHIIAEDTIYLDVAEREISLHDAQAILVQMNAMDGRLREHVGLENRAGSHPEVQ